MKIGVVGRGAVGTGLADLLRDYGFPCFSYGRQGAEHEVEPRELDLCFFATKAYDLAAALEQWCGAPVNVVLCNGDVSSILAASKVDNLRRGIVTFGMRPDGDGYRMVGNEGEAVWGGGVATDAESVLAETIPRLRRATDIESLWRKKWMVNVVINTICAAKRLACNGDVIRHHQGLLTDCACELHAYSTTRWPDIEWERSAFVDTLTQIIRDTDANENSMARDVRLGRQTEVEFLSGTLDANTCPVLAELTQMIVSA